MNGLKAILLPLVVLGALVTPPVLAYLGYQWLFHGRYLEYIPWLILFYIPAVFISTFAAKKVYRVGFYAQFVEDQFNWVSLFSIAMALYMLYAMIFENATWVNLVYVLAVGFVSQWIAGSHRLLAIKNHRRLVSLGIEQPSQSQDFQDK